MKILRNILLTLGIGAVLFYVLPALINGYAGAELEFLLDTVLLLLGNTLFLFAACWASGWAGKYRKILPLGLGALFAPASLLFFEPWSAALPLLYVGLGYLGIWCQKRSETFSVRSCEEKALAESIL